MNKVILFLKGMLLYITFFFTLIFVMGVDSIYDQGLFLPFIGVEILLVALCKRVINEDEIEKLTFTKILREWEKKKL